MLVLLYLILILGLLIFVHELGHFIFAKMFGVHIYEFALGMGPRILKKTGKDGIIYSVRAFPIGGFVSMAGEVDEDDKKVKKDKFMCNKPWIERVIVLIAGVTFNFIFALLILFVSGLIWGSYTDKPIIGDVVKDYPMAKAGIEANDLLLEINGYKVKDWDKASTVMALKDKDNIYIFKVLKSDGTKKTYNIKPIYEKDKKGEKQKIFGFYPGNEKQTGLFNALKYTFRKFGSIVSSMAFVIAKLFTGQLSLKALSGPVGMYSIVDDTVKYGVESIIYLVALLSVNLGFLNILPFPAFDGGRVLFLIIEKIKGSKVNPKVENIIHTVGFALLMLLMLYITLQDVLKLF